MKKCKKCLEIKNFDEFIINKKMKNNAGSYCKMCFNLMQKNWRDTNKIKQQRIRKRNYIKNKDNIKFSISQWQKQNKDRIKIYNSNSRGRRIGLKDVINLSFITELLKTQNNLCFYCNCDIFNYFEIEHKTPLSRGGNNTEENICLSCMNCNRTKKDKTEQEYYEYLSGNSC